MWKVVGQSRARKGRFLIRDYVLEYREFETSSLEDTSSSSSPSSSLPTDEILPLPTPHQPILPSSPPEQTSPLSQTLPQSKQKTEGIMDSVPTFHGKNDGYQDPTEYLEMVYFADFPYLTLFSQLEAVPLGDQLS